MKHTKEFFKEKYHEFIDYSLDTGTYNPYVNLDQFISDYEELREGGSKNVMKDIKYYARHEVSYKTARAMLQQAREFGGTEKLKDLQDTSTRAFADKYLKQLKEAQKEAYAMFGDKINPKTGQYERIEYIGVMWFGSE